MPGFEVAFARGALVEPAVGGFDRDPAALRHRVACVDAEVQDRVFELVGIDHRGPYARRADHLQRDAGADGALDEIAEIGDQPVDVGRLGIERLAARKGEQPVGQRRGTPRRPQRCGGVAIEVADTPLRDAHLHHLDRARDAGEHVVEIVRQAAGELADRLHLLRLPQMRFGDHQRVRALLDLLFEAGGERAQFLLDAAAFGRVAGAFGDVADEGDLVGQPGPGHGVVEVEQRDEIAPFGDRHVDEGHSGQALQPLGRVTGARVVVDVADRDRLAALQILDIRTIIAKVQQTGQRLDAGRAPGARRDDRFGLRVDRAVAAAADVEQATEDFDRGKGEVVGIARRAQPVVELDQRLQAEFGALARVDVEADAGKADRAAHIVELRLSARGDPAGAAVGLGEAIVAFEGRTARQRLGDLGLDAGQIVRVDAAEEAFDRRAAGRVVGIDAVQAGEGGVGGDPVGHHVPVPAADAGRSGDLRVVVGHKRPVTHRNGRIVG